MSDTSLPPPRELSQSSVLLVGGTSGVGLASAIKFAQAGAPGIALVARTKDRGEAARDKILQTVPGAKVTFIAGDVNTPAGAKSAVGQAHAALGRIDVLLCTTHAGTVPSIFHKMPPEDIEPMLAKQVLGPIYACRFALPYMREQRSGSIITVSSDAAKIATPGEAVMGGCMAAIVMFTRTLAMECKRDGIRANVLTPALISNTPSNDAIMADEFGRKLFAAAGKMAALGITSPEDIADTVLFLASPASAKLTGQAISVNGGMSAA